MITQPGWLRNTNFGGNSNSAEEARPESTPSQPGIDRLLSIQAAGTI
jgi:hypothetical protein